MAAAAKQYGHPFRTAVITTDAHAACIGAHGGKDGGVIIAGTGAVEAIQMAGIDNFRGKVVIDATNPLDMSVRPPRLLGGLGTSSGELIQKALGGAFVVSVQAAASQ